MLNKFFWSGGGYYTSHFKDGVEVWRNVGNDTLLASSLNCEYFLTIEEVEEFFDVDGEELEFVNTLPVLRENINVG